MAVHGFAAHARGACEKRPSYSRISRASEADELTTSGDATLTPNELIRQADEKLFQAKHDGRNRVVA
jgi:GGDEF domain-containing protein